LSVTTSPTPAQTAARVELSHREIMAVFAGLMTAMLLAALDQTIVATALPTIVGELGGLSQLSWVVTSYLLASTVSIPLYGKISDLYGRKRLFQGAIAVFAVGSIACGVAGSMGQLIAFRAIQGVGAGGILALTQTIVGDIVSPRERGRYMGYIGAVFGLSSVLGPLLGGYFVDNLDWRWVFYINVPLAVVALVVTERKLPSAWTRTHHQIDFLGAGLLVTGITALLLALSLGGETFPWSSAQILGLVGLAVVALAVFVAVERRVEEPVLPLSLLRNPIVSVSSGVALIVGMAMFGAIIYLPLFLQVVIGVSATYSGLLLLPVIAGLLITSITSGRLISRWGRYRVFPIVGTAVLSVGLGLLSTMGIGTPLPLACLYMLVVGAGIGLVLQVVVLVVQNAVEQRHLGTATASTTFFRSIGGTLGVALFGALLNARVGTALAGIGESSIVARDLTNADTIAALPAGVQDIARTVLADAITGVFAVAVPLALVGFALAWFIREIPLRTTAHTTHAEL